MSGRVSRINCEVKKYDTRLYAVSTSRGSIEIHRKSDRFDANDIECDSDLVRHQPQFILALTNNWKRDGSPTDWGLEPVMETLRSMDSWAKDSYPAMVRRREREKEDKERQLKNELRAKAADMRKDFAEATNEINTSTIEKVDLRRKKDGSCK